MFKIGRLVEQCLYFRSSIGCTEHLLATGQPGPDGLYLVPIVRRILQIEQIDLQTAALNGIDAYRIIGWIIAIAAIAPIKGIIKAAVIIPVVSIAEIAGGCIIH